VAQKAGHALTMPQDLNEVIHSPYRLQIMAIVTSIDGEVEFRLLRDTLEVSDSVLSKHLKVLSEMGYLNLEKTTARGRVRTWVSATIPGKKAYRQHIQALQSIVGPVSNATLSQSDEKKS